MTARTLGSTRTALLLCLSLDVFLATACDQDVDNGDHDGGNESVVVAYDGTDHEVALGDLDTVDIEGTAMVLLSAVVEEALPEADLATLEVDFEASDGFSPGDSPNCTDTVPVAGDTLEQGYIDPATRNVTWAEELGFPGCMRVDDVARIIVTDQ